MVGECGAIASAKASGVGFVDQQRRSSPDTTVSTRAAAAERDDRRAARLRLERHDAEILFARQQDQRRGR